MGDGSGARYDLRGDARLGDAWRGAAEGHPTVLRGPGYLYRPGQILVADEQEYTAGVVANLRGVGGRPDEELTARFAQAGLPVRAFHVPDDVRIPDLVERLRAHEDGKPTPDAGPNHVLTGQYEYQGGPEEGPEAGVTPDEREHGRPTGAFGTVAVLDTGYDHAVRHLHPGLYERLEHDGDEGPLTADGFHLREAEHGTLVAGIIVKSSPDLRVRPVRVLDSAGVTDDATVALGLALAWAPVVNLSLGGYTHGGRPPAALATALAQLDDSVAVVAAAGNNGADEPFWPAAFKRVVAVGALDMTTGAARRADFSNYGHWVDLYAPGTAVHSTYLDGSYQEPGKHLAHLAGWAKWSGTSFAAPQVAAEIAKRVRDGVTAWQAMHQVLAEAMWVPGVGAILLPAPDPAWL